MKPIYLAAAAFTLLCSCEKNSTKPVETGHQPVEAPTVPSIEEDSLGFTKNCYYEVLGKDSVFISVEDNLGTITGKMRYKNFEKDSSYGTLYGTSSGDTLKLTYDFESEGMHSQRDIYFLKKGNTLAEGLGDYVEEGSHARYKSPAKLNFTGHQLQSADCKTVDASLSF